MRPGSYFTLFFCILLLSSSCSQHDPIDIGSTPDRGFRSNRPADKWEEGLVSGNGIMGAMVMGHPLSDTIIVNHASLYMPVNEPLEPVSQGDYLEEIRSLMLDGQYGEASRFVVDLSHEEGWEGKRWTDPIIPAFDIVIDMEQNSVKDYAHYPAGHNEGYPSAVKNFCRNIYRYISGESREIDFATFEDGHNADVIVEAVIESHRKGKWIDIAIR